MKFRGVTSKVKTSSCSPSCSGMWANETCMKQNPKGKRRRVWPCAGKDEAMRHQSNSCWIAASLWPTVPTLLSMWKQLPKMQSMCPQCHLNCQVFRKRATTSHSHFYKAASMWRLPRPMPSEVNMNLWPWQKPCQPGGQAVLIPCFDAWHCVNRFVYQLSVKECL